MTAYVISDVEVLNETHAQRYRELAAASIARHGGRYLVRGADRITAQPESLSWIVTSPIGEVNIHDHAGQAG
jgi:uncharacterized protein (DUF1330 family)